MKRLVKCSKQPIKAATWTIYMDYDDEFGRNTVSEEFTGTWFELRDYIKDLNKNTDYYNIDAVEHDWEYDETSDDLYSCNNI